MFTCSKCLLHTNFWERIYPSTTQIILTINAVTTRIRFINAITTGRDLVSYRYQSEARNYPSQIKRDNPQPVKQNWKKREHDP